MVEDSLSGATNDASIEVIGTYRRQKDARAPAKGAGPREKLLQERLRCRNFAYETGLDAEECTNWKWHL